MSGIKALPFLFRKLIHIFAQIVFSRFQKDPCAGSDRLKQLPHAVYFCRAFRRFPGKAACLIKGYPGRIGIKRLKALCLPFPEAAAGKADQRAAHIRLLIVRPERGAAVSREAAVFKGHHAEIGINQIQLS